MMVSLLTGLKGLWKPELQILPKRLGGELRNAVLSRWLSNFSILNSKWLRKVLRDTMEMAFPSKPQSVQQPVSKAFEEKRPCCR